MKKLMYLVGLVCILSILPSCEKSNKFAPSALNREVPIFTDDTDADDEIGQGQLSVRLISKDCDVIMPEPVPGEPLPNNEAGKTATIFSAINLDIKGVKVYNNVYGWQNLNVAAGVYDLITLQNEIGAEIAGKTMIKEGGISKMMIVYGRENSVMVRGKIFCLQINTHESIIEIDGVIRPENVAEAVLQISICKTIVLEDQGEFGTCYFLSPNIKLVKFSSQPM